MCNAAAIHAQAQQQMQAQATATTADRRPTAATLTEVREKAIAKQREVVAFLHEQGHTTTNAQLDAASHQLIEIGGILMGINFALANGEATWGDIMGHLHNLQVPGQEAA